MRVARSLADLAVGRRDLVVQAGQLSFIPTMGALHDGHMALVDAARVTGAAVAVSIFVNPTQFAVNDDFATYPRDEAGDLRMLERAGCDLVWLPDAELMYPPDDATRIDVAGPALRWEGDVRPGHFRGVATVCAKLFGQIRPTAAIFGEKDWQQLCVVRRMVANLHLPLEIVGVPTVREPDGLAMSSRNRRLSATERKLAGRLPATLQRCVEQLPERGVVALSAAADELIDAGFRIDYLALVDGDTLEPLAAPRDGARIIAAARLGSVRLLDNLRVGKEVAGLS
jgi:pantoate--beta-alanine ligase